VAGNLLSREGRITVIDPAVSYAAGLFPYYRAGRRLLRIRVPRKMKETRKTMMPMISRYSSPLTTAPVMPRAMAAMMSSRNKIIVLGSFGLAPGQAALAAGAGLVGQAVVLE
jgi:hypothetical protein